MKKRILIFTFLPILIIRFLPSIIAGNQIDSLTIELKNCKLNETVYLQKYYGKNISNIDSFFITNKHEIVFKRDNLLEPGMYVLSIHKKPLVNFFISDSVSQNFTISIDFNNFPGSISFANTLENQEFIKYLQLLSEQQKSQNSQAIITKKGHEIIQQFPNSMLALFIQTMQGPEIHKPNYPINDYQEFAKNFYINHFLDNVNFSDQRILNTPFLEQKLGTYFKQMVPPLLDSIVKKVDLVLKKTKANDKVYNWAVLYLYSIYREVPNEQNTEVYNFIGKKYILSEPNRWNDSIFIEKVRLRVSKATLNPIRKKATNLILRNPDGKMIDLYSIKANYTILFFYNPDCDACKLVSSSLSELSKQYRIKGVEVFAVYMDTRTDVWNEAISTKGKDWINVFDAKGSAKIEEKYDIYALPMIYLLDNEKKIVAKDITVKQLEEYFK